MKFKFLQRFVEPRIVEKWTNTKVSSPELVVTDILGRGIKWYDEKELDYASQLAYYNNAVQIRSNEVLLNEVNHALADIVQHIASKSVDFAEVRDLRMTMNGLQLLLDRLSAIQKPVEKGEVEEPYIAI